MGERRHNLDWNAWKGIARCTGCSWTSVTWTQARARHEHDQHQADVAARPTPSNGDHR